MFMFIEYVFGRFRPVGKLRRARVYESAHGLGGECQAGVSAKPAGSSEVNRKLLSHHYLNLNRNPILQNKWKEK